MKTAAALIGVAWLAAWSVAIAAQDQSLTPANAAAPTVPAAASGPAATEAPTAPPEASNAAADAAAPAPTDGSKAAAGDLAEGHVPTPPPGKSQVVFFRTGAYAGAAVWYNVRENGVVLGKLGNQAWFPVTLDPGVHTFTAATENRTSLRLELEPGETQYVRGTVQMGFLMGEPKLAPGDKAMFEEHYAHMKQAAAPAAQTDAAAK